MPLQSFEKNRRNRQCVEYISLVYGDDGNLMGEHLDAKKKSQLVLGGNGRLV
jgi:hypothetical protein